MKDNQLNMSFQYHRGAKGVNATASWAAISIEAGAGQSPSSLRDFLLPSICLEFVLLHRPFPDSLCRLSWAALPGELSSHSPASALALLIQETSYSLLVSTGNAAIP